MTLIVDAGGLLSVFDGDQDDLFLEAVQAARGPLVVSPLILAALDHFILGRGRELAALEEIEEAYQVERFAGEDLARAHALLSRYADLTTLLRAAWDRFTLTGALLSHAIAALA